MTDWKRLSECVRITSQWVTLVGERWRCDKGNELEYWRVEKADSVIVLPLQAGNIFCVAPTFRPGIGRATLGLPGGRVPVDKTPREVLPSLLRRELGIPPETIRRAEPLNDAKWILNSAFSNQGIWAFVAELDDAFPIARHMVGAQAPADAGGVAQLLEQLDCLQCRAVLRE
jgi:hypothetical protein